MKTFKDEYRELLTWYFAEQDKIDAMNIEWEGGLDGGDTLYRRQLADEYHKRLKALEVKYNKHEYEE